METKPLTNELIKEKATDAMVYRGYLNGSFDDALLPGIYWISSSRATDYPPGAYGYGVLKVYYAGEFLEHEYTSHATGSNLMYCEIFKRIRYGGVFNPWVKLSASPVS